MIALPYIVIIAFFFILVNIDILNIRLNKMSYKMLHCVAIVIMILFTGLRWEKIERDKEIIDYSGYVYIYNKPMSSGIIFFSEYLSSDDYHRNFDPGFVYLSSFFRNYLFNSPNLFFLLISLVTIILFAKGLKRNEIQYGILLIFFVYLTRLYFQYNFILIRQGLALVICWWAIPLINERRFWKFSFFCCLAGLMHFSGFVFIVAYFLPKFQFSNKFIIVGLPILFIFSITGITNNAIIFLAEHIGTFIGQSDKVGVYTRGIYSQSPSPLYFLEMLPFFYFAMKYKEDICKTSTGKFFFNMLIFYIMFSILTMGFMGLMRFSIYYIYSFFFIISYMLKNTKIYGNRIIYGYAFCVYFLMFGVRYFLIWPRIFSEYHIFLLN